LKGRAEHVAARQWKTVAPRERPVTTLVRVVVGAAEGAMLFVDEGDASRLPLLPREGVRAMLS